VSTLDLFAGTSSTVCETCDIANCEDCSNNRCTDCAESYYVDHNGACVLECDAIYF
jgi:hypothetical protein